MVLTADAYTSDATCGQVSGRRPACAGPRTRTRYASPSRASPCPPSHRRPLGGARSRAPSIHDARLVARAAARRRTPDASHRRRRLRRRRQRRLRLFLRSIPLSPTPSPTSSSTSPPRDFRFCIDRGAPSRTCTRRFPAPPPTRPVRSARSSFCPRTPPTTRARLARASAASSRR